MKTNFRISCLFNGISSVFFPEKGRMPTYMLLLLSKLVGLKYLVCFLGFLFFFSGTAQSDIVSVWNLPQSIRETSGLIFHNGKLITHNDSGNAAELYELDVETQQISRTIQVADVGNMDWEDLTQDDNYIYIGDFGNNLGARQDLSILRIAKSEFDTSDLVTAERISFSFEDQTDFTPNENSDFDVEAVFSLNDNLIVLTKQWQQMGTAAYRIPKEPGSHIAEQLGTYQVDGLVTGATFDTLEGKLYLVGYSRFLSPFFVMLSDVSISNIFGNSQEKVNLSIGQNQLEAITLDSNLFYVTSEEFINLPVVNSPAQLFTFTLDDAPDEDISESPEEEEEIPEQEGLFVYKMANSQFLNYRLTTDRPVFGMGIFDSTGKMVSYTPLERISEAPIDISALSQGLYYLSFLLEKEALSAPFFRD